MLLIFCFLLPIVLGHNFIHIGIKIRELLSQAAQSFSVAPPGAGVLVSSIEEPWLTPEPSRRAVRNVLLLISIYIACFCRPVLLYTSMIEMFGLAIYWSITEQLMQ